MTDVDLDAWLDDYQPHVASTKVVGRADLIERHQRAEAALLAARQAAGDVMTDENLDAALAKVRDLEAQMAASTKEFTFTGVGHEAYQDLKRAHPPDDEDAKHGLDIHMATFAPALIVASSHEPKINRHQHDTLARKLPEGEYERLFQTALEANGQVLGAPKSVLAAVIDEARQNGGSSTTAAPTASPDPDSLADPADPSPSTSTTTTGD